LHPILIDFGWHELPILGRTHLFLPTYGVLFATGALLAWWWFMRRARTLGVNEEKVFNLGFYSLLAGILGAKLALIAVEWRYYLDHPTEVVSSIRSAGVLMGGVLFGSLAFAYYARRSGLPLLRLGDAAAAPLALAQSIGRLGCFSAGCCYGVPGHHFTVTFTDPMAAAQTGVPLNLPLVPTQLIQMTNDLILSAVLTWLWRRRIEPAGSVFWWYVLLYGITRAIIENWRGDTVRGLYFGGLASTSQILAAAAVLLAAIMLVRGRMKGRSVQAA
jgi:phosphatidylglycerol:prolipoprotein diacylglycerol transferase